MAEPNLSDALANLLEAQNACETATQNLVDHNTDLTAHSDIRAILDKILSDEAIYTNAQIVEIINDNIADHIAADAMTAHPTIATQIDEMNSTIASMEARVSSLEIWRDNGTAEDDETSLTAEIQKVVDEYSPIIKPLRDALDKAITAGQTESVASLQDSLNRVLDEQTEKIKEVIDQYRKDNTPTGA